MNFKMTIANQLADNIDAFIALVDKHYKKDSLLLNIDKFYQIKLLIEEYKFQVLADELHRINTFVWNEDYSLLLVGRLKRGLAVIDEYVERNYEDLFLLSARLYTIKNLSSMMLKFHNNYEYLIN